MLHVLLGIALVIGCIGGAYALSAEDGAPPKIRGETAEAAVAISLTAGTAIGVLLWFF
jgi:hypothetical protein